MGALLELAKRCEFAAGPDRALDRDIADALGLGPDETWERPKSEGLVIRLEEGGWVKDNRIRSSCRYTGSLDQAMTLVPETATFEVCRRVPGEGAYADVDIEFRGGAATPALALCAAALRALATKEPK